MVIDIILIALFLIALLWGMHKGGVKIIASLASFIIALVLAYTLAGTIGDYIKDTNFGSAIQNAIETNIVGEEEKENTSQEDAVEIVEDQTVIDKMEDKLNEKVDQVVTEGKEALTEKIIATTFYGIGFLITFIGVKITLFIAFAIVEFIFKLPVLNAFNKLVGGILEVVLMLAKLWMVLGLISFIAPLDFMQKVVELINGSVITKLLYDNNIIVTLIIGKII